MTIQEKIREQIKDAMRSKDEIKLTVLRGLMSAFTNENVAKKRKPDVALSDEEVLEVISRAAKQRKDSIEQFEKGGRNDLAEAEKKELSIIEEYLPEQMSDEVLREIVIKKKEEMGITDKSGMGQLMGVVMREAKGQADGNRVKQIVEEILG